MSFKFKIVESHPTNLVEWETLVLENNNLLQSVHYDNVQSFFNQKPCFIELYDNNTLVAGYKFYFWESARLPKIIKSISRNIVFFGEPILNQHYSTDNVEIVQQLNQLVNEAIEKINPTTGSVSSFYGDHLSQFDISYPAVKHSEFNIAYIELKKSADELWGGLHPKHRNSIRKGQKEELKIQLSDDIDLFIDLLKSTYKNQPEKAPNFQYIKHNYTTLKKLGFAKLVFAYHQNEALAGAFITTFGTYSYYSFGGTVTNNLGAGNYLHWEIILMLKKESFTKYFFGQVTKHENSSTENQKFAGISQFKRRFGTVEVPGNSVKYVLHPIKNRCWGYLKKLLVRP